MAAANFGVVPGSSSLVSAACRRSRWTAAALMLLLACGLVVAGEVPAGAQSAGLEADFGARVTAERRAAGVGPLAREDDLVTVARRHSAEMAASNRLSHNTLLGRQVQNWLLVAENVGVGFSVGQIHEALMASPQHRADILDARFTGIGIGVVQSGATVWVTQVFRRSAGASALPGPAPSAPAPPAPVAVEPARVPAPAPAPPPPAPAPALVERPAPPPRTTRPMAARVPAPTTMAPATTTAAAAPPAAVAAPDTTAATPGAGLDLDTLAAASSPLPPRSQPVTVGLLAAALLWAVSAGAVRVAVRTQLRGARG